MRITIVCLLVAAAVFGIVMFVTNVEITTGPPNNQTEYTDKFGRVCTQVDPPGPTIAIDCDYPKEP